MDWKELWNKNYRGEGDTAELEKYVKTLDYGSRNNINYLPWATVERIFKLQDGEVELYKTADDTCVEVDRTGTRVEYDENGVVSTKFILSYFINVCARWQGREYVERYPLQDSMGRPLTVWTQNDLNKAYQRAKVKAIANVSGIGYKIFEDGDLQFDDAVTNDKPVVTETKTKKPTKPEVKVDEKKVITPEPETNKETVEEPSEPLIARDEKPEPEEAVESRQDMEIFIKNQFINGGADKSIVIRTFLKEKNILKINNLTDKDIKELFTILH